jgi:hypothetical protein
MSTSPIRSSTQEHLDIEDIVQNLILLKDGGATIVLKVGAVNFDLLSEEEQDAIIYAYAALLNSLTFPAQILIRSQQKDITNYLKLLESQEKNQASPIMRKRLSAYRIFVEKLVKERRVLDKKCYVAIPFFRTELGLTNPTPFISKKTKGLPYDKPYIIEKALASLEPKRDHLLRQFGRIGLTARQLSTQDLIELFYSAYNPKTSTTAIPAQSDPPPIIQSDRS